MASIPRTSLTAVSPGANQLSNLDGTLRQPNFAQGIGSLEHSQGVRTIQVEIGSSIDPRYPMGTIPKFGKHVFP
jgi:hypothetical protein